MMRLPFGATPPFLSVIIHFARLGADVLIPPAGEEVTPETFRWSLDWERIREARAKDEGTYLLRTNLEDCDPKTHWKKYMIQGEIEYAFRELKGDLGLRPVYHQLEDRIEAHIFTSFMALCLLTTLRAIARRHSPGRLSGLAVIPQPSRRCFRSRAANPEV